jgi:hypothetical protein
VKRQLPEGATVKIKHFRRVGDGSEDDKLKTPHEIRVEGLTANPHGGRTEVTITTTDGREALGVADVYYRDNFSRSLGRQIATGRALKELDGGVPGRGSKLERMNAENRKDKHGR